MFNRLGITFKLVLLVLISLAGFAALSTVALQHIRETMIADRAAKIRNISEIGRDVVAHYYK